MTATRRVWRAWRTDSRLSPGRLQGTDGMTHPPCRDPPALHRSSEQTRSIFCGFDVGTHEVQAGLAVFGLLLEGKGGRKQAPGGAATAGCVQSFAQDSTQVVSRGDLPKTLWKHHGRRNPVGQETTSQIMLFALRKEPASALRAPAHLILTLRLEFVAPEEEGRSTKPG